MKKLPNLHQSRGNLYYVKKQPDGKRPWILVGTVENQEEAIQRYQMLWNADHLEQADTIRKLMNDLIAAIENPRNPLDIKPKTAKEYLRQLKPDSRLSKVFGAMAPNDIRVQHIAQFLSTHPFPTTANREIALLSRLYSFGVRQGKELINPCLNVKRNKEKSRTRYIADWEYQAAYECMIPPVQIAMELAYLTGQRISVVLGMESCDYDETYLKVLEEKTGTKARIIVNDRLRLALEASKPDNAKWVYPLVRNRKNKAYTLDGFESLWRRGLLKAIDQGVLKHWFTFHDIRAKHATDAAELDMSAQHALGHADDATTNKYLRHPLGRIVEPLGSTPMDSPKVAFIGNKK